MKAIIEIDIPEYQIGQEVNIYFKDTMQIKGIVKEERLVLEELEKIKAEIREWYWQADKQKISKDPCVVDAMTDLFIRTVDNHISELKGENK